MCGFALYCLPNDDNNNWNPLSDNNIVFRDFSASTCHVGGKKFFDKISFLFKPYNLLQTIIEKAHCKYYICWVHYIICYYEKYKVLLLL